MLTDRGLSSITLNCCFNLLHTMLILADPSFYQSKDTSKCKLYIYKLYVRHTYMYIYMCMCARITVLLSLQPAASADAKMSPFSVCKVHKQHIHTSKCKHISTNCMLNIRTCIYVCPYNNSFTSCTFFTSASCFC